MFPLGSVVFPTMILPLQIFEPRYQTMMQRLMQSDGRFGTVWIESGHEVGGGENRSNVGTMVHVQEATELDDGRWVVLGLGLQRIRVTRWLDDDPFPQAEIESWPDSFAETTGVSDPNLASSLERVLQMWHDLVIRGGGATEDLPELNPAPDMATLQLSALLPLASQDRQSLLIARGPAERLELLDEYLTGIDLLMRMQEE